MLRRSFIAALVAAALGTTAVLAQSPGLPAPAGMAHATFAGGCFWCMEPPFDKIPGVVATTSGYMGGTTPNPTYKSVTAGGTGHLEVVQVTYDPKKVTYERLLETFWRNVDPYDDAGQFCDKGDSYRTAIFAHTDEQRAAAEAAKKKLVEAGGGPLKKPIVTRVLAAGAFTQGEDYHQDYYKKNPTQYSWYRMGCGRDARLEAIWGRPSN